MINACCFDLETSSLNADFGIILCGCIKPAHEEVITIRGDKACKRWKSNRSDDSATCKAIAKALEDFDIIVAHNGHRFDLPFLRTRLGKWGLKPLGDPKILDPVKIARNKLRLSYNSLERVGEHFGYQGKTVVHGDHWIKASHDGCTKAMDYIVSHCEADVALLEHIVDHIKHYSNSFNSWGSGW